jgi:sugar/nucleoside kinase (ribokinase family)
MLQREVPDSVNVAVAQHARKHGVPVTLDLGGDDAAPPKDLLSCVDFCWPNETEVCSQL